MKQEKSILNQTSELVQKDMGIVLPEQDWTEDGLIDHLADAVAYLLEHRLEHLFSLLYLMDVNETKVHDALSLSSVAPANVEIAKLILDRQKAKVETRIEYQSDEGDGWFS